MMKILLAPDKFKGSRSAAEVCALMRKGFEAVSPDFDLSECAISDGGDGFTKIMQTALKGSMITCEVKDAIGRAIEAPYAMCDSTAVIEMSAAAGIRHLAEGDRDIWQANTFGVGQMIRHAAEVSGAKRILLGLGGSATNDAGCGMAAALGVQFFNTEGQSLEPTPRGLKDCVRIDARERIDLPSIIVACDVENPLLGPNGATEIYGPQKGASATDLPPLEAVLENIVRISGGQSTAPSPGAGAAGGLGFGLMHFANASLTPGFPLVAEELRLKEKIEAADVVITGEGCLDAQTAQGKGPAGIAQLARESGTPVYAITGIVEGGAEQLFDGVYALHDPGARSLEETIDQTDMLLVECASALAREILKATG